jgi:hypothetical protein
MYMFPEMINMGLKEGQEWPNEVYKEVAKCVLLCNPRVTTRDVLNEGVQKILSIPEDKIKTVTYAELPDYGFDGAFI